ncbi:MAG: hypothetical protein AB1405_03110 [Bdellovibrionota bacterium]
MRKGSLANVTKALCLSLFALALLAGDLSAKSTKKKKAEETPAAEAIPQVPAIPPPGSRTLKRTVDPIVVTGDALASLSGKNPSDFQLFAYRQGRGFVPIPFQVDQRDERGRYLFEKGPDARADSDKGAIDSNDELVFMAFDIGDEAPSSILLPMASGGAEFKIVDPVDGGAAWAYLLPKAFSPEVAPHNYVTLSEEQLEVIARDYIFRNCRQAPIGFDHLAIRHGDQPPINIVDRLKIRGVAKVLGIMDVSTNEGDLKSKLRGSIDGPVRVIRRSRNSYELGGLIPTVRADAEWVFYPNHFYVILSGKMPFDADKIASKANLRVAVDYTSEIQGARFYTGSLEGEGVLFDGTPEGIPSRKDMSRVPYQWGAIYGFGPEGKDGWFSRMIPGPTIPSWFDPYIVDDPNASDPPEREKGRHDIGFSSDRMVEMKGGEFWLKSYLYRLDGFDVSQVTNFLNVTDKPLTVETKILRQTAASVEAPSAPANP